MFGLNDDVYKFIYGDDVDVEKLKQIKTKNEIWDDIMLYLVNNDITKIEKLRKMKAKVVLSILNSKLKQIPKKQTKINPIGFN